MKNGQLHRGVYGLDRLVSSSYDGFIYSLILAYNYHLTD